MGNLPAATLGFASKKDGQFDHRSGPLGRPPHTVLAPPPRLAPPPNPFSVIHDGIRSYQRGVKNVAQRLAGKVTYETYFGKYRKHFN